MAPNESLRTRLQHARRRGTADNRCSQKQGSEHRAYLGSVVPGRASFRWALIRRSALPVDVQIARLQELRISGNQVSCGQTDQIIGDNFVAFYSCHFPSRRTVALRLTCSRSLSIAFCER